MKDIPAVTPPYHSPSFPSPAAGQGEEPRPAPPPAAFLCLSYTSFRLESLPPAWPWLFFILRVGTQYSVMCAGVQYNVWQCAHSTKSGSHLLLMQTRHSAIDSIFLCYPLFHTRASPLCEASLS